MGCSNFSARAKRFTQGGLVMTIAALRSHAPAKIPKSTLTRTMVEKHIIDANASIRGFAKLLGIDYVDTIDPGQKVTVDAEFTDGTAKRPSRSIEPTTGETDGSRSRASKPTQ